MPRTTLAAIVATLLATQGCQRSADAAASLPRTPESVSSAVESITPEDVLDRISVLAHDSMRGRDTPSPELEAAAAWIAGELGRFGLRPGGDDGTFIQRYAIQQVVVDHTGSAATVSNGTPLAFGSDLGSPFATPGGRELSGPLVVMWGADGTAEPPPGTELAGAHVVLVTDAGEAGALGRAARRLLAPLLARQPASVLVATNRPDPAWDRSIALQAERSRTRLSGATESIPAVLEIRDRALDRLLAGTGRTTAELRGQAAQGAQVDAFRVAGVELTLFPRDRIVSQVEAPNVVGILPGSDPGVGSEYVVFSAHMDHVGVGSPDARGDSIFNGADDDASGTATVVELAEAFSLLEPRPRRSLVFLLVSGEEKGLWGSQYFADNPPIPIERVVANLNIDMVGRNWPDTIVAIGKEHSDLGATLEGVVRAHPELGMTAIDDLWPDESFYTRSDHFNFARKGVQIVFFFNGTHQDYHRPSDEVDRIDGEKTSRIGRLIFYLGLEVADADRRPAWNPESYRQIVDGGR